MKKISLLILLVVTSFYACERSNERTIKGVIIHKATGQPMEGVKVLLQDGLGASDPVLGSGNTSPQNFDSTFTDANGRYEVQIKTKSNHGFIYIFKDGYLHAAESVQMVAFKGKSNTQEINLEMNGRAFYNPTFIKTSATPTDDDSLIVNLHYYEWKYYDLYPSLKIGKGPFKYYEYVNSGWNALGDRYVRYHLKFKTGATWHTKLDSVYIPTSMELFTDTVYY